MTENSNIKLQKEPSPTRRTTLVLEDLHHKVSEEREGAYGDYRHHLVEGGVHNKSDGYQHLNSRTSSHLTEKELGLAASKTVSSEPSMHEKRNTANGERAALSSNPGLSLTNETTADTKSAPKNLQRLSTSKSLKSIFTGTPTTTYTSSDASCDTCTSGSPDSISEIPSRKGNTFQSPFNAIRRSRLSKGNTCRAPDQSMISVYSESSSSDMSNKSLAALSPCRSNGSDELSPETVSSLWLAIRTQLPEIMKEVCILQKGTEMQWLHPTKNNCVNGTVTLRDATLIMIENDDQEFDENHGNPDQESGDDPTLCKIQIEDLRTCIIIGHVGRGYIEVLTQQTNCPRLVLYPSSKDDYVAWLSGLLLISNLKSKGIQEKIFIPALQIPNKSADLLVCHFSVYFPGKSALQKSTMGIKYKASTNINNTQDGTWQFTIGVLSRSGVLLLLNPSNGSVIQEIDMTLAVSSQVQEVHFSLFAAHRVLYVNTVGGCLKRDIITYNSEVEKPNTGFYIKFATVNDYEDWFLALRSFTKHRIFCPSTGDILKSMRVCRTVTVKILEGKRMPSSNCSVSSGLKDVSLWPFQDTYVEVTIDGLLAGRTSIHQSLSGLPFWREEFHFSHFPVCAPNIGLTLRQKIHTGSKDEALAWVDIPSSDFPSSGKWLKLEPVHQPKCADGDSDLLEPVDISLNVAVEYEETMVLAPIHYSGLERLLIKSIPHHLTPKLAEFTGDLNELSEICLNLFQAENRSLPWLSSLIDYEIDKLSGSSPKLSETYSDQLSDVQRNIDNTLFRGNSLLTKSIEQYMKLTGKDYLNSVIGTFARKLVQNKAFLEIDPSRIEALSFSGRTPNSSLEKIIQENRGKLMKYCDFLWKLIRSTISDMPYGFKLLFKRVRIQLERVLGKDTTVAYNAISGFLFLRFFSPALLNPKLFDFVQEHPTGNIQRSLTLATKVMQGFANRVRFGMKEPWLMPMNEFIDIHERELIGFYKKVSLCDETAEEAAAQKAKERHVKQEPVPSPMGENPSNPFLIDKYENFAKLVKFLSEHQDAINDKRASLKLHLLNPKVDQDIARLDRVVFRISDITANALYDLEMEESLPQDQMKLSMLINHTSVNYDIEQNRVYLTSAGKRVSFCKTGNASGIKSATSGPSMSGSKSRWNIRSMNEKVGFKHKYNIKSMGKLIDPGTNHQRKSSLSLVEDGLHSPTIIERQPRFINGSVSGVGITGVEFVQSMHFDEGNNTELLSVGKSERNDTSKVKSWKWTGLDALKRTIPN